MAMPQIAPYGSWRSPITADLLNSGTFGLGQLAIDGEDCYWLEGRPQEGGRMVIVRRGGDGTIADVTPAGFNVRSRVHEYGGGAYFVADRIVYFTNFADNRLYRQLPGGSPEAITPEIAVRYADMVLDRSRDRLIAVIEDHRAGGIFPENWIGIVPLDGQGVPIFLAGGHDFAATPRVSPDGTQLAWLTWDHPNMPWDGTTLWRAAFKADGTLGKATAIAGGADESIVQPTWSPDGILTFSSDRSGWWNLYRHVDGVEVALAPMAAEFSGPQWVFRADSFDYADAGTIIGVLIDAGETKLYRLNVADQVLELIATSFTNYASQIVVGSRQTLASAASATEPWTVIAIDHATGATVALRRSATITLEPGYLSVAMPIAFPTEGGQTAYAFYYAPKNQDYRAPTGELPPLLVLSHGGPTSATSNALNLGNIQYWTSRGFAVVDVNYGGSTGYGREYRRRLNGQWGVVDRNDCVNAAQYLVKAGWVDGERLTIAGGSAGGFTTLNALTFCDVFKVGASYYGIGDLTADFADEGGTHKFESQYSIRLVAPWPEGIEVFRARSAIFHIDQLNCPVIFFQGLDDMIVPPIQSEMMVSALRQKGIPVAYLAFEGEGHGFRRAENLKRSREAHLAFFGRILGFTPADTIAPVTIDNLD